MELLSLSRWSPYIVGAGIGVLIWISFILSNRPIGCSTAYARTIGLIERMLKGKRTEDKDYYKKLGLRIGWEMMLVIGVVIGALISSLLSNAFIVETVPALWATAFGSNTLIRFLGALIGGFLVGFGARMAGGCTSGHGISGTLQLAVGSWVALICFFVGGFLTAIFLYVLIGGV